MSGTKSMLYQFTETIGMVPSPGLRPPSPHAMGRGQGEGFPLIPTEFHCEVVLHRQRSPLFLSTINSPNHQPA